MVSTIPSIPVCCLFVEQFGHCGGSLRCLGGPLNGSLHVFGPAFPFWRPDNFDLCCPSCLLDSFPDLQGRPLCSASSWVRLFFSIFGSLFILLLLPVVSRRMSSSHLFFSFAWLFSGVALLWLSPKSGLGLSAFSNFLWNAAFALSLFGGFFVLPRELVGSCLLM